MPETVQQNTLEQQVQPAPVAAVAPDVDKMSLAELESFVKQEPAKAAEIPVVSPVPAAAGSAPAEPVVTQGAAVAATPAGQTVTAGTLPAPGDQKFIEIKSEDGSINLKFRNQEEVQKSLLHAQKLIRDQKTTLDRLNSERGEFGQYKTAYEESQTKIDELANYIAELQQSGAQIQAGQSPTAIGAQALQSLTVQPGDTQAQVLLNEVQRMNKVLLEEQTKNEKLRNEMTQTISDVKSKEQEVTVNQGVQGLYTEVSNFSQKHPEYQTSQSFDKLDDIVSTYGEEAAKAMITPDDFEKYTAMMELVGMYKNNGEGEFDLKRKNFNDLEEAHVLKLYRSGELGKKIAQAHTAGIQNFEQALNRSAQSATVLPNNLVSRANNVTMGPSEIESILNMDPAVIAKSPELSKQFEEAVKSLGINTMAMSQ